MILFASTVLGKFSLTTFLFLGIACLTWYICTFPDEKWRDRTIVIRNIAVKVILVTGALEVFFALLSIWGIS